MPSLVRLGADARHLHFNGHLSCSISGSSGGRPFGYGLARIASSSSLVGLDDVAYAFRHSHSAHLNSMNERLCAIALPAQKHRLCSHSLNSVLNSIRFKFR